MTEKKLIGQQILDLLKSLAESKWQRVRGYLVKERILYEVVMDPREVMFDFPPIRLFNFKYLAAEYAFYFSGDLSINFISKYAKMWSSLTDSNGKINSNYGYHIFHTGQFRWVIDSLKNDKYSRQAIININQQYHKVKGTKDFPCAIYQIFWIREDQLFSKVVIRSNDIFYGTTYDMPWFGLIHQLVWRELLQTYPDLQLGLMYYHADNIHFYERHEKLVIDIITQAKSRTYKAEVINTFHKLPLKEFIDTMRKQEPAELNRTVCKNILEKYIYKDISVIEERTT